MLPVLFGFLVLLAPVAHGLTLPSRQKTIAKNDKPNIVLILADDLHNEVDMLKQLPNIHEMKKNGVEFPNHISQSPVCGPSRASLLSGLYPHNHRYISNNDPDSPDNFKKIQGSSVGEWLTKSGYYTAFLGKYVNGLNHNHVPSGWRYWGGFNGGGTYIFYNTTQWQMEFDEHGRYNVTPQVEKIWTGVHQSDFLANQTVELAQKAVDLGQPFFIFTNPAMVHSGPCYGPMDDASKYDSDDTYWEGLTKKEGGWGFIPLSPCPKKREMNYLTTRAGSWRLHSPDIPSWNKSIVDGYSGPLVGSCCNDGQTHEAYPIVREKRTSSAFDLDDMIGDIVQGLKSHDLLDNTYVIFTSDNGFHLGEHRIAGGKKLPYQTDIRVPLVIRVPDGSNLQRGVTVGLPTNHIDITRTIVELAGAESQVSPSVEELDGNSFAPSLSGDKQPDFPRFSYSEMFEPKMRTWRAIQTVNDEGEVDFTFHVWCNGEAEVFKMADGDPYQLTNLVKSDDGQEIFHKWLPIINGMGTCSGANCGQKSLVKKPFDGDLADMMECREYTGGGAEE